MKKNLLSAVLLHFCDGRSGIDILHGYGGAGQRKQ